MNKTAAYGLNQWEKTDRIQMEDFNADNQKVEQALAGLASTVAEHTAALAQRGNCQVVHRTYVGTNTYGSETPTTLQFDAKPLAVFIKSFDGSDMMLIQGCSSHRSGVYTTYISWSGNQVSWYSNVSSSEQFNASNTTYYITAILDLT